MTTVDVRIGGRDGLQSICPRVNQEEISNLVLFTLQPADCGRGNLCDARVRVFNPLES